ncbi:hypothetical protein BN1723_020584, partial [Verticillium longisporum]
ASGRSNAHDGGRRRGRCRFCRAGRP